MYVYARAQLQWQHPVMLVACWAPGMAYVRGHLSSRNRSKFAGPALGAHWPEVAHDWDAGACCIVRQPHDSVAVSAVPLPRAMPDVPGV